MKSSSPLGLANGKLSFTLGILGLLNMLLRRVVPVLKQVGLESLHQGHQPDTVCGAMACLDRLPRPDKTEEIDGYVNQLPSALQSSTCTMV